MNSLLLFLIIGVFMFLFGVVLLGGCVTLKCPRDLFTNRGSEGLTSADRRTSLLSRLQYPVP